jgi:hypothetical protein
MRRLLPHPCGLPRFAGGSASASLLSRPAQASLALRPIGSLDRQKRPLSRGSGPSGHPSKPLVSYRINRQFSGWNLPPLVVRAFGAHCINLDFCSRSLKSPRLSGKSRFVKILDFCAADRFGLPREGRPPSRGANARFNISIAQTRQLAAGRVWKFTLTPEHLRIGRKRSRVDGRDETRP